MRVQKILQPHRFLFFLLLINISLSAFADAQSNTRPSCTKTYDTLSKELSQVLADGGSKQQVDYVSLNKIETKLFTAFEHCPKDGRFYALMGENQVALGNVQLAHLYAQKSMQLNAKHWQAFHILGNTLCMLEKCHEGVGYLLKALKLAPAKPELQFNLCSSYMTANMPERAVTTCTQVLARKDHVFHGATYYIRGQAHEALGSHGKAKQDLKKAQELGYSHTVK